MPYLQLRDIRLYYESLGSGPALFLVHGSWGDGRDWTRVFEPLAANYTVVRYDRRGHSRSEDSLTQGSPEEDADDLAALARSLNLSSIYVAANSWGGIVALHCVRRHPGLIAKLALHEPPLFDLIKDKPLHREIYKHASAQVVEAARRIEAGDGEDGAKTFVETAVGGPGSWDTIPAAARRMFIRNAKTFLDEMRDPDALYLSEADLRAVSIPVLLTQGTISPPVYAPILEVLQSALPVTVRKTFDGAGHLPQISHPEQYCSILAEFLGSPA